MRLTAVLLFVAALCSNAYAGRAGTPIVYGTLTVTVTSGSTLKGTWTTGSAGNSRLYCGTSAPSPTNPGASNGSPDNGIAANGTSHSAIVAGLVASTAYQCLAISNVGGALQYFTGSATTAADPSTTAITGVTLGSQVANNTLVSGAHATAGDSYFTTISNDGVEYITQNDSTTFGLGGTANMMFGTVSPTSPVTPTNLNVMSGYGNMGTCNGTDVRSPKLFSLVSYSGVLYATVTRLYDGNCPGYPTGTTNGLQPSTSGQIIKSSDHGVTWCNFQGACSVNGVQTTPTSASFFEGNPLTFGGVAFIEYGADSGGACPGVTTPVDNCDAYAYLISNDNQWINGSNFWLARIPLSRLPRLNGGDVQFYQGGDGRLDAAWGGNFATAAAILTNANKLAIPGTQYIPSINRYLIITYYFPSLYPGNSNALWYDEQHPWSTPTLFQTTTTTPQQNYTIVPTATSVAAGTNLLLLTGGNPYEMWTWPAQLTCGGSNC